MAVREEKISMRQMMSLLYISLLALGAGAIPALRGGGAAAWIAPLLALLPVLLLLWLAFRRPGGGARRDLGALLLESAGQKMGRAALAVFLLWNLSLLIMSTARCANRLAMAEGTPVVFSAVLLGLAGWMGARSLPALARSCEIFYIAMMAGLVGMLILGAFRLEPSYVLLFTKEEFSGSLQMIPSILGVASVGLYALFLAGDVTVRKGDGARVFRWTLMLFLSFSLLLVLILGSFGAALAEGMEEPLLQMVAGLSFIGTFQRLESLVSALWMLGDVALLGLLLFSLKRVAALLLGRAGSVWTVLAGALAAFAGGELLAKHGVLLQISQTFVLPLGSLAAGLLLVPLFFWTRRRGAKGRESG